MDLSIFLCRNITLLLLFSLASMTFISSFVYHDVPTVGKLSNPGMSTSLFSSPKPKPSDSQLNNDIVEKLRERAAKLRAEVAEFEKNKKQTIDRQKSISKKEQERKEEISRHYSVNIPILKNDGRVVDEDVFFSPRIFGDENMPNINSEMNEELFASSIIRVDIPLPLGVVLGEEVGVTGTSLVIVDEINEKANEVASRKLKIGDIIRCCSATQTQMSTPTWQLIVGGIGQPKTVRFMYSCDGRPFEEVLDAVKSNRMDPLGRDCVLVIERKNSSQ